MYMEDFLSARLTEEYARKTVPPWVQPVRDLCAQFAWIRFNPDVPSPHTSILEGFALLWSAHPDYTDLFPATPSGHPRAVYP